MSQQIHASNARSIENYGLWETLRRESSGDSYYVDDEAGTGIAPSDHSWPATWRGRAIRWSLAGGVFLAYVNHWPGGH